MNRIPYMGPTKPAANTSVSVSDIARFGEAVVERGVVAVIALIEEGRFDPDLQALLNATIARRDKIRPVKIRKRPAGTSDPAPSSATADKPAKRKVKAAPNLDDLVCYEPQCGARFTDKKALFEHRAAVHGRKTMRQGPRPQIPDPQTWVEWTGKVPGRQQPLTHVDAFPYGGRFYDKAAVKGKMIRLPQDFGNGVAGARVIIDGVGPKSVKVRFFDPPPKSSRFYGKANGVACFLPLSILKEHLR